MHSTTKLLNAIVEKDTSIAELVLREFPESALEEGPKGESPILLAIYNGRPGLAGDIARIRKANVCEAAALGDAEALTRLLDSGASPNETSFDGWTALHLAAFMGSEDATRTLLKHGASIDAISTNGTANTPLCAALAGRGNTEVVQILLDGGADVNALAAHGVTPLHLAASRGADNLVRELVTRGANVNAEMDDGTTPSAMAEQRGFPETAQLISSTNG